MRCCTRHRIVDRICCSRPELRGDVLGLLLALGIAADTTRLCLTIPGAPPKNHAVHAVCRWSSNRCRQIFWPQHAAISTIVHCPAVWVYYRPLPRVFYGSCNVECLRNLVVHPAPVRGVCNVLRQIFPVPLVRIVPWRLCNICPKGSRTQSLVG